MAAIADRIPDTRLAQRSRGGAVLFSALAMLGLVSVLGLDRVPALIHLTFAIVQPVSIGLFAIMMWNYRKPVKHAIANHFPTTQSGVMHRQRQHPLLPGTVFNPCLH